MALRQRHSGAAFDPAPGWGGVWRSGVVAVTELGGHG